MIIYLIGSFMNDNFGDYLLYHETIAAIEDYFGDTVRVISSETSSFYDKFEKVDRVSHSEAMKISDAVIFTGGGILEKGTEKKYYGIFSSSDIMGLKL